MKTIGIITYHHYYNYGTMLQAYALQKKVASLGYVSELIDFKQDNSLSKEEKMKLRIRRFPIYVKEFEKYFILANSKEKIKQKKQKFEDFYNKCLVVGKQKYTNTAQLIENPPQYDAYIVGSDQTWNPYVANSPEAFYLPFVSSDSKKGSYGPSLAVSKLTEEQKILYKDRLCGFAYLSCRESEGASLLEKVTGKKVVPVVDPTLLLTGQEWNNLTSQDEIEDEYILTYFLGDKKEHRKFVAQLSESTGLRVVSLPHSYLDIKNNKIEKIWGGPKEFLSLIRNASVVCTDSFHGTMFSINFNTNFYSFCKMDDDFADSENSRLYCALELFGLSHRLVKNGVEAPTKIEPINFKSVNNILEQKRRESMKYLVEMLQNITRG
jgi:hypothetical protein